MEHDARMGEFVASGAAGDVLSCIGLGSCIGLALIDRRAGVAGLAHVMLPEAPASAPEDAHRYADRAVPAMFARLEEMGGARHRLEAALVGGAQMFALGSGSGNEIGARNKAAVEAELKKLRIPVRAQETGGTKGRSMTVDVTTGEVLWKCAATEPVVLIPGRERNDRVVVAVTAGRRAA